MRQAGGMRREPCDGTPRPARRCAIHSHLARLRLRLCARAKPASVSMSMTSVKSGFKPWQAMRSTSSTRFDAKTAAGALIGDGRIREAVRKHDLAFARAPAGSTARRFGRARRTSAAVRWWRTVPGSRDRAGCGGSAVRSACRRAPTLSAHHSPSLRSRARQHPHLRALAAAVGPFEGDEEAAARGRLSRRHSAGPFSDPPRLRAWRSGCRAAAGRKDDR